MTRVVLTLPEPRGAELAARLASRGHDVVELCFRELVAADDAAAVAATFTRLGEFDWVVFVSPGSVAAVRGALPEPWPDRTGVAAVGPGTLRALAGAGVPVGGARCVSPASAPYDADALMRLAPFAVPAGERVLVVAGDRGRGDWIEALARRGARVERLCAYRSVARDPDADALATVSSWSLQPGPVAFVVTSVDAARRLHACAAAGGWLAWAREQPAVAPHGRITEALAREGWHRVNLIEPGEAALVRALESSP